MTPTRLALTALSLVLVAVGAYSVAALTPAAATPPTAVRTVGPLDATGALQSSYRVTRRIGDGTCQLGSFQVGSAYRCASPQARQVLLDPCWPLAADPATMICQDKPWQARVVEVHLVGTATGGPTSRPAAAPWGLALGRTVHCLRDVGAVLRVAGNLLAYHCSHHRDVIGPLQTTGTTWRAHVYRTGAHTATGEKSIGWQPVTIVWRGAPISGTGQQQSPPPAATPTVTSSSTTSAPPAPTETATATATA